MLKKSFIIIMSLLILCQSNVIKAQEILQDTTASVALYDESSGEMVPQPFYIYTHRLTVGLSLNNGVAGGIGDIYANPGEVIKIVGYMYLQKVYSDGSYTNIASWYDETTDENLGSSHSYSLKESGTYRIMMVYNVYHKPMQYEVITAYSNERVYKK